MLRKIITPKYTKKDIGKWCLIKGMEIYQTNNPPIDKYVWKLVKITNCKQGQNVYLIGGWCCETIWKLPAYMIETSTQSYTAKVKLI